MKLGLGYHAIRYGVRYTLRRHPVAVGLLAVRGVLRARRRPRRAA